MGERCGTDDCTHVHASQDPVLSKLHQRTANRVDSYAQGALNGLASAPSPGRAGEQGSTTAGAGPALKELAYPAGKDGQVSSSWRQIRRREEVLLVVGLVVLTLAFAGGLAELWHRWSTQEEYSHGFFIPLIS